MFESADLREPGLEEAPAPLSRPLTDERGMLDFAKTLSWLAEDEPGPEMMKLVALLASVEEAMSPDQRIELLVLLERCESWLNAVKQPVFAGVARDAGEPAHRKDQPGQFEDTLLESALALRWSEWMVYDRMKIGAEITRRLDDTSAALARGDINFWQARRLAEATRKVEDNEKAALLERRVLAKAAKLTRTETGALVDRELIKADPEGAEKRRKNARNSRQVSRGREEDGMANLHAFGPVEDIAIIDLALSRGGDQLRATGQVDDMDQGRFDTLLSWATDYLRDEHLPGKSARPTTVNLVMKKSTADGLDDDPAHLDRWGPVTAHVARDLAGGVAARPGPFAPPMSRETREKFDRVRKQLRPDADKYADDDPNPPPPDAEDLLRPPEDWDPDDWDPPDDWPPPPASSAPDPPPKPTGGAQSRPLVSFRVLHVDADTGWLLPQPGMRVDFGRDKCYFTGAVREFVLDRFRVCEFPGCNMPRRLLDADHWKQRAHGGNTDATTNAGPACTHHNRTTRNRAGWDIEPNGDGTATLITPQGRRYPITPFNYLG